MSKSQLIKLTAHEERVAINCLDKPSTKQTLTHASSRQKDVYTYLREVPTVESSNASSVPDDGGDVTADFLLDFVLEIREHGAVHEARHVRRAD